MRRCAYFGSSEFGASVVANLPIWPFTAETNSRMRVSKKRRTRSHQHIHVIVAVDIGYVAAAAGGEKDGIRGEVFGGSRDARRKDCLALPPQRSRARCAADVLRLDPYGNVLDRRHDRLANMSARRAAVASALTVPSLVTTTP